LAQDTAIYQQGGSTLYDAVAAAVKAQMAAEGLPAPAGPITVSTAPGEADEDIENIESKGAKFVVSIGAKATDLATRSSTLSGVFLFVPNPAAVGLSARPQWAGVSPYPALRPLFQYLKTDMKFQRVAVLYTKKKNQEMAKLFEAAAREEQVACKLLGLSGPEELARVLPPALKESDALLLLIDPIAFSPDAIRFVITTSLQEKKPVVGFMDSIASVGVPFAIYTPPDEIAKVVVAALKGLKQKGEDRRILFPGLFVMSVNEAAINGIGGSYDSERVVKRY
jgi:ABC-type uncharacterized transport system substrate-binding protein